MMSLFRAGVGNFDTDQSRPVSTSSFRSGRDAASQYPKYV